MTNVSYFMTNGYNITTNQKAGIRTGYVFRFDLNSIYL